jgi:hypothetical protein
MKAAKAKAQEDEELKEKRIAERLYKLSIETGRATSLPSPFYVSINMCIYVYIKVFVCIYLCFYVFM